MSEGAVVVIGSTNVDESFYIDHLPDPGETTLAYARTRTLGGKGANQATSAVAEGARVTFVTALGEDEDGSFARSELARVNLEVVEVAAPRDAPTGSAVIWVDSAGENSIVVASGVNSLVTPDAVILTLSRVLSRERVGLVLMQGEFPPRVVDAVAEDVTSRGLRFVLNLAPAVGVSAATLRRADPLILNEGEATKLAAEVAAPSSGQDPMSLIREAVGCPLVVTRGSRGALFADERHQEFHVPAMCVPRIVDATGAGDAFVGALVASLARSDPLAMAVNCGIRAGAIAVGSAGAR